MGRAIARITQIGALSAVVLGGCAPGLVIPRCPEPAVVGLRCDVAVNLARASVPDDAAAATSIEFRHGTALARSIPVRANGQPALTVGHVVFTRPDGRQVAVEVYRDGDSVTSLGPIILDD